MGGGTGQAQAGDEPDVDAVPKWYRSHARLLREPFGRPKAEVDWLTWEQVEHLYLRPQRADAERIMQSGNRNAGGQIDQTVHTAQPVPDSFEEFLLRVRAMGMEGTDDELRAIHKQMTGA